MVRDEVAAYSPPLAANIEVKSFDSLLVEFAKDNGAGVIVPRPSRGLRFRVRVSDGVDEPVPG